MAGDMAGNWKCEYCGESNTANRMVCAGCGAPRGKIMRKSPSASAEPGALSGMIVAGAALLLPVVLVIAVIAVLGVLFYPRKDVAVVVSTPWERVIYIEKLKTFKESDWDLPSEARLRYTRREIHHYRDVIDHYERSADGTYEKPVYRQEPVYNTKYYYEIDRWMVVRNYTSKGDDHEPYWNEEYTLQASERDTKREEHYWVVMQDLKKSDSAGKGEFKKGFTYDEWLGINKGMSTVVTHNIFGYVYKENGFE